MRRMLSGKISSGFIVALAMIILLVSACAPAPSEPAVAADTLPPLKLGVTLWVGYAPLWIADAQGFFEQEGVEVEIIPYDTTQNLNADFAIRSVDVSATLYADTIAQAAAGIPVEVVWVFDNSLGGDVVVGHADIARAEDLRGKRVGLAYGTFSHAFVVAGLAAHGLTPDDVTIVNVSEADVPAALAAGEIDAGHTFEPFLSDALAGGSHVLFTSAETPGVIVDLLAVQSHIIETRPQDIEALLRAIVAAQAFWAANPDAGNAIVGQALDVPADEVPLLFEGLKAFTLADNVIAFDPGTPGSESLLQGSRLITDLMLDAGVIDRTPDFERLLNPTFVQAIAGDQ